ncbi:tankyrase 1 binding protein 1 [Pitangus sulphuratus]|nr:tankyrase 1 binding protein 1 [Pitangus sulphuratus]
MASQPQPLRPAVPCAAPAGTAGAGLAGSPDKGTARPKPPVRPKPRVLPKPAVPAKPAVPPPVLGPRHPRPELPSAEKMNRLAGPQPYSGGGTGGPLRRPSFTVRSPETPNGKGLPLPPVAATEEETPPAPPTPSRKGPTPFKVTPVPVAARPERFPGTTVEEILAKMDSREGPGSPDRTWLSPFCPDPSSRFGSKTFTAFRKRPSGEADGEPPGEAPHTPRLAVGELGMGDDEHSMAETSSPPRDVGLRRSSEGVLQSPPTGQGLGQLGGSLSALPRPGDPLSEPSLGSESSWSLSQSFEWTFPSRGARLPAFPPHSPIWETPDSGLSEEGESEGEAAAPSLPEDSGSEGPDSRGAEGAPCPGGPVAQREAEGLTEEEEEGEAERGAPGSQSPLCVTEPGWDPAEPEPPTQPSTTTAAPSDPAPPDPATPDPAPLADLAWAGDSPKDLQGPGGPGQAEGPPQGPDPHADPGWLTELLASPGAHTTGHGPLEDLLGWSRKDLCSEFGICRPRQAGTFDWSCPAVSRERDWPAETKQDQEFRAKSGWDSTHSDSAGVRPDGRFGAAREGWSSDYRGTELMGDTKLGGSDWSQSLSAGESCLRDPDFSGSTAKWGPGYGLGCTSSAEELDSGQPTWVGRYGTGDTEMKDRELTPDWASKFSSQDAGSRDEDFTLGWAGRSSTGDTGSLDKELSPSRPAWDSRYSTRDMESQDREFSPSRPAWTAEYRDTQSQDREFSPSQLAEGSECSTSNVETQDREFSPSGVAWDNRYSTQDMESQDREFSPSRSAWTGEIRDMESQDRKFGPRRPAWTGEYRDVESQDQEFSPSRLTWDDRSSSRDTESQDREFHPSRPAEASECTSKDLETQDGEFGPSRAAWGDRSSTSNMETEDSGFTPSRATWDDGHSTGDMETWHGELFSPSGAAWGDRSSTRDVEAQDREFSSSGAVQDGEHSSVICMEEEQELIPGQLSCSSESSIGQAGLVGVREEDVSGSLCPDPPAQKPTWGSAHQQEHDSSDSRDWAEELGGGDCHNQFGGIRTEWVPDPCSTGASDSAMSRGLQSLAGWHRDLSLDTGDAHWSQDLESWSMEPQDAEAKHQEWASAFGARCAARSRDCSTGEWSLGGDTGTQDRSLRLSAPSPPMGDAPADPPALQTSQGDLLSPTEEERDLPEHATALQSPGALSLLQEAASGIPVDTGTEEPTLDHPDGDSPPGWGEERLSLGTPQPEEPMEQGQEFPFLEDTELLDSSVFRSKASLGRKRRHRAPALRPTAPEGDSWIFRDSTGKPRGDREGSGASVLAQVSLWRCPCPRRAPASPSSVL